MSAWLTFHPPHAAQDITPQYDDATSYWTSSIPEYAPHSAADPGNMHVLAYPATYGHKWQVEHSCN